MRQLDAEAVVALEALIAAVRRLAGETAGGRGERTLARVEIATAG